jgi:hypothetical protein
MYNTYAKSGCERKVRRRFQCNFQDVPLPNRKTIHKIENKLRDS